MPNTNEKQSNDTNTKLEQINDKAFSDAQSFMNKDMNKVKNSAVPKPPGPGEIMYCQHCGKPMLPKDFSKDEKIRRREFKWQIHHKCEMDILNLIDRSTPGLLSERRQQS